MKDGMEFEIPLFVGCSLESRDKSIACLFDRYEKFFRLHEIELDKPNLKVLRIPEYRNYVTLQNIQQYPGALGL